MTQVPHDRRLAFIFGVAAVCFVGCSDDDDGRPPRDDIVAGEGLTCALAKTLETYCWGCHGDVPVAGAPFSLLSRSDLLSTSVGLTRAARSVARMRSQMSPMPPLGPRVPEAEIAELEAWIAAGTPEEECAAGQLGPARRQPGNGGEHSEHNLTTREGEVREL